MRNWLLASLLILAVIGMMGGSSYAQGGVGGGFQIPGWWGLILIGIAISIVIITISYMIGEATGLPNVKAFAKQEVYELIASAIIIIIILTSYVSYGIFAKDISGTYLIDSSNGKGTILFGACTENKHIYDTTDSERPEAHLFANIDWFLGCLPITSDGKIYQKKMEDLQAGNSNYNSPNENLWEAQRDFFGDQHSKGVMLGHMMNVWAGLLSLEFLLGPISTFGISAFLPEGILSSLSLDMAPMSGLTPISEALVMIADMVGVGMVIVLVQKILLEYIYQNALAVFLPIGLAFKAIPFLRKTGATIIAASLVLYFIFPMTIWVNEQIYFSALFKFDEKSGEYIPELIDWTNYNSLLEICTPKGSESYYDFKERILKDNIEPFYDKTKTDSDGIINGFGEDLAGRLPRAQQREILNSIGGNTMTVFGYFFNWASITGPILPIEYLFEAILDSFTVSMQWFVLNLLFLANSIILSITFFKDLSIAIGGEPRIFGMSKLV